MILFSIVISIGIVLGILSTVAVLVNASHRNYNGKNVFSWYVYHAKCLLTVKGGQSDPWSKYGLELNSAEVFLIKCFTPIWALLPFGLIALIVWVCSSLTTIVGLGCILAPILLYIGAHYFLKLVVASEDIGKNLSKKAIKNLKKKLTEEKEED